MALDARPILVIEDSEEDFDTVREALERSGLPHPLRRSTTGTDGLELLHGPSALWPALVLMDLNTPAMDGRDALAAIKGDPALRELPVVVLSTSGNPKDLAFCYRAGANAYHVKPVRYPEHLQLLVTVLEYWLCSVVPSEHEGKGP